MANKKLNHLTPRPIRIIIVFVVAFLVFEAIFYFTMQDFNKGFFPFDMSFYIYTPAILVVSVVFCVLSITQTYYEIEKDKIVHHKMGKVTEIKYKDILYVDEEWSKKHKMVLMYLNDGRDHYLAFDKDEIIYNTVLEKANLMTWEEYKIRFPNAKK